MQITCPSCSAQYSVNEARIPPQGVSIKCPKCERSFTVQAPAAAGGVPLPGAGAGVPLPGGGGGGVPLPGGGGGGVPLPGAGMGGVPLPGGGGGVPLPGGGAGGVPLPGAGGAVPLPGGGGAVPLPGGGGAVPLPGGGGAVPLPGGGGAVPLPGGGGAVPLPGGGGGVPLPGVGASVPLPGGGGANPFAQSGGNPFAAAPAPAPAPKPPGQAASLSDIFGDVSGPSSGDSAPAHPFHGDNSFIVSGGSDAIAASGAPAAVPSGGDGLLDFMTNRGGPGAGPQMFRIKKRSGQIIGPFDEATVLAMFQRQELAGNEEASSDGNTWRPLGQIPAFKETIQRAMAAALSGLDLPGLRNSTDLPGLRGSTDLPGLRDADAGVMPFGGGPPPPGATAEEIAQYATASSGALHPAIIARRRRKRVLRMAAGLLLLVVVAAGAALEFVTPFGAFGWRKVVELVNGPPPETLEKKAPPPLPELPEPTVPASQLLALDTYVAYRQGSEQQAKIVSAGKALQADNPEIPFPPAAQKAAGEQARFLAYLIAVEQLDVFKADLAAVIPLAVPGDLGKLIGEVALAYGEKRYEDGIKMLEPLTDESKGLAKGSLSEVHTWIGMGRAARGEALAAQKSLDIALQARTDNLVALWLQGSILEKASENDAALGYAEKVLALAPEHPRANLLKAHVLVKTSETRKEGRDLLAALSEGKKGKDAAPIQKAEAFIAQAELAIGDLEWDRALKLMNAATSAVPQNREMRLKQGDLALKLREFSLARDSFKALVDMDASDVEAIVGLARAKIGSRDALGGYTDLQTLIATKKKDPLLTYWFGVAARELLKLEEARKTFQQARALDPKWAEPAYELIVDLVDQGKLKQALDLSQKAEGEVDVGQRHRIRAVKSSIFMRQRNYSLAEKELAAALKENPTDVDARVRYVELMVTLKKLNEAAKHAKEARLFDPKNPSVIAASGIVEAARGDHKRALELFEEATTLAPNDHRLYLHAAQSAIALSDFGRAKGFVDAAGQLQPKNPEVLNYRGQVMRATDPKQAVRIFLEAIDLSPEDPRLPFELGNTFQRMGLNLEAKDAYQEAINIDPSFADAFYGKGVSLRELGKNTEAVVTFKEVTRLDKNRSDAHIQLAEILAGQGDPKGAIKAYQSAQRADPTSAEPLCEMGLMLVQSLGNEAKYLKEGVKALERCVEKQKKHTEAFRKLGDAYREMRKPKLAIEAYRTHMRNNPEDLNNPLVCESLATLGAPCE